MYDRMGDGVRSISKKMVGSQERQRAQKVCRLNEAIDAARHGALFETNDLDVFMESLRR